MRGNKMTTEEVSDIVSIKYQCKERSWATGIGDGVVYIFANFLYHGTARPIHWKDGEVIDNIEGVPVIFRRMDIQIGGDY
jgi:hypothetical protein